MGFQQKDPREIQKRIERQKAEAERRAAATEKQRQLWDGLNRFIRINGGWLTSLPSQRDLRVEIPQGSELPDRLFDLGYDLHPAGSNTRISGGLFVPVQVYTFRIPMGR